jgi:hypothetical protein
VTEIISAVSILHELNPAIAIAKNGLNYFDLVVGVMVRDFFDGDISHTNCVTILLVLEAFEIQPQPAGRTSTQKS